MKIQCATSLVGHLHTISAGDTKKLNWTPAPCGPACQTSNPTAVQVYIAQFSEAIKGQYHYSTQYNLPPPGIRTTADLSRALSMRGASSHHSTNNILKSKLHNNAPTACNTKCQVRLHYNVATRGKYLNYWLQQQIAETGSDDVPRPLLWVWQGTYSLHYCILRRSENAPAVTWQKAPMLSNSGWTL